LSRLLSLLVDDGAPGAMTRQGNDWKGHNTPKLRRKLLIGIEIRI
jgi:hypothetical protein